jgi:predicted site-specific integrase-resolvase
MKERPYIPSAALVTPQELAKAFGVSTRTLERWRVKGRGPTFIKSRNFVRYLGDSVNGWLVARSFSSTAEARRGRSGKKERRHGSVR